MSFFRTIWFGVLLMIVAIAAAGASYTGTGPLSVIFAPPTYTPTTKSGTITLGGTAQVLMAANVNRVGCSFQPQAATNGSADVWINTLGGTAGPVQPSLFWPAPSVYTCPPGFRGAISIYGTTTGATFYAEEDTVP